MNIFEKAARLKLRFPSTLGNLMVEQLWDLPLTSTRGLSLNDVAKTVNGLLKDATEDNFVSASPDPAKALNELRLEIVKFVIADKQEAAKKRAENLAKIQRREELVQALHAKNSEAVKAMSKEDIEKELAALDE